MVVSEKKVRKCRCGQSLDGFKVLVAGILCNVMVAGIL